MKQTTFNKARLAIAISALLGSSATFPVWSAEQANDEEAPQVPIEQVANDNDISDDENVVTIVGIRGSLMRSMNQKRDAQGVVDVISSEDIGKFPDTNLAESLQRITGVSISRSNGEGSQLTVRGWGPQFNLITLNGRQMPGTGNTRNYSLENLSSDGVSALEVHKTSRADNPSGGLGATVNIVTTKPFETPGFRYSVSAKAINDTSNEVGRDFTPEISGMFSNTVADDTLGFSVSFNHHRRDFQKQSANVQGWQANVALPNDPVSVIDARPLDADGNPVAAFTSVDGPVAAHFFPRDMNYSITDYQRERTNAHAVFQFEVTEDIIVSTDYTYTNAVTAENGLGWGMWMEYGGNINSYELDANGTAIYADIGGNDGSFTASRGTTEVDEKSVGFNIDWTVSDSLTLTLDYHDSSTEIYNGADKGLGSYGSLVLGSDQLTTKIYDFRNGEIPHYNILWNNGSNVLARGDIDSHFSQFIHSPGYSEIQQLQIDGSWENLDTFDIPLVKIDFGVARTEQDTGGSHAWSGLIGGFLFNPSWPEIFPDSMFTLHDTSDLLDQFEGGGTSLNPGYYYSFSFDEVAARSAAFLTNDVLGGNDYFALGAYHPMGTTSSSAVTENTDSLYVNSFWDFDIGNMPTQINLGFRYEETEVPASALINVPEAVWWLGGAEWLTQYSGERVVDFTGEYDMFLPMFDMKVEIMDDLIGRFSYGKSLARPDLGSLNPSWSLSGSPKIGSRNGSEGNTGLLPYESTNLDLSLEWYYGEDSYAAIGYYRKEVKNFIGTKIFEETYEGIRDIYQGPRWNQAVADIEARGDQATSDAVFAQMQANGAVLNDQGFITPAADDPLMVWAITRPFNDPDPKEVDGFEVAVQHVFGDTGFGLGANATIVDGDISFDVMSMDQQSPLVGLSDSYNFQAFYENDFLSVKITYAWRDAYLIGVGQGQGSSEGPPQYAKEFGQWDMSVNYEVFEGFTVFFEGLNLNNETEQHYGRFEEQFLRANQYGPRYVLGARYTFK